VHSGFVVRKKSGNVLPDFLCSAAFRYEGLAIILFFPAKASDFFAHQESRGRGKDQCKLQIVKCKVQDAGAWGK
jgi:hypothetical protein